MPSPIPTSSASTSTTAPSGRPQRPRALVVKACQTDDVSLISQAISLASSPSSRETVQEVFSQAVTQSIYRNAPNVLTHVLAHGGEVPTYSDLGVEEPPSTEILAILLGHGWDINARRLGHQPFLWQVVGDGDLIAWCLEHGATAIPKDLRLASDDERRQDQFGCSPILESAASQSTVATFELLRSRGAPFGPRMLHFAARAAIKSGPGPDGEEEQPEISMLDKDRGRLHSERMAMVIHIVDTLGVDANALDQPAGWTLGNHWGTPLCYVARSNPNWDCNEVVQFLLQKGADPGLVMDPAGWDAIELAKRSKNQRFLEVVENWKARQREIL
ncbi:hypothetical protein G7Y89_g15813 [Cudoniella acicularis]|uniref:Uncharacterized protein n=1 Tax=Cudoniella acicularis TaxID=354080 RepID=A0A8H4VJ46_9HELO|nr:hypothetical protein G7Y89_g15813 [Cudoniella acicularis]